MSENSKKPSPEFLDNMQQDASLLNAALDKEIISKETVLKTESRQAREASERAILIIQNKLSEEIQRLRSELDEPASQEATSDLRKNLHSLRTDFQTLASNDSKMVSDTCLKYSDYIASKMQTILGEKEGQDQRLDHAREALVNFIKESIQEFNTAKRKEYKLTKPALPAYAIEAVLLIGSRADPKKTPRENSDVDIIIIDNHRTDDQEWKELLKLLEAKLKIKSLQVHHARSEPIMWKQILTLAELKNKSLLPLTNFVDSNTVIIAKNEAVEKLLRRCMRADNKRYQFEPQKTYV